MLATLTVTTLEDDATAPPEGSLRAMIAAANATPEADEIVFEPGLAGSILLKAQLPTISRSLTITGPGAGLLTLDAGGGATAALGDGFRIIQINQSSPLTCEVVLEGLTLTGGDPHGSSQGGKGGAVANFEDLTICDCVIAGNTASSSDGDGGGIYSSGKLTIISSTISGNSTAGSFASGGGLFCSGVSDSPTTIFGSTISGNSTAGAFARGGGIYCRSAAFTIASSTISGNSTAGLNARGGGMYLRSGHIIGSTISGNWTSGFNAMGGGISTYGRVTLTGCTVSGNAATAQGGGLFNANFSCTIESTTITANTGGGVGSVGTARSDGTSSVQTIVRSSIIAGNTGSDVAVTSGTTNTFESQGANVIGSGNAFGSGQNTLDAFSVELGDQINVAQPLLGPLADNGGPTHTHALLPGSPALDHGAAAVWNAARGGVASQSSEWRDDLYPPDRPPPDFPAYHALDGSVGTITHTSAADAGATWQVDLLADYPVRQVVLYNRQVIASRLRDITVTILDAAGAEVFTSALLNPENVLGGMTLDVGPEKLTVDLIALTGGPLVGRTVRVHRAPDPDLSGSGGEGNEDEPNVLSLAEVEVFTSVDQRGLPRAVGTEADAGAYEASLEPTADFDANGQSDGHDFLAWQRGLGKVGAVRADGDSDGDGDVDSSDLAAWRVQFGATDSTVTSATHVAAFAGTQTIAAVIARSAGSLAADRPDRAPSGVGNASLRPGAPASALLAVETVDTVYAALASVSDFTSMFSDREESRSAWRPRGRTGRWK